MRLPPILMLAAALSTTACLGSGKRVSTVSDHPPAADLSPDACPVEPSPPGAESLAADPFAPERYIAELIPWGRCNEDARARVCSWHLERAANGAVICTRKP